MRELFARVEEYLFGVICVVGMPLFHLMSKKRKFNYILDKKYDPIRPGDVFSLMSLCGLTTVAIPAVTLFTAVKLGLFWSLGALIVVSIAVYVILPMVGKMMLNLLLPKGSGND
jgi:hypothetical protein